MSDPRLISDLHGKHPVIRGKRVPPPFLAMDQNFRQNLIRLRKRSVRQNEKAHRSLEDCWVTEARLREYFYDLPRPPADDPPVLLHLSPDHNKA